MEREEILQLVNAALDIIEKGKGENGFPYVAVELSNYSADVEIRIIDGGFKPGHPYDGVYEFNINKNNSARVIRTCKEHLKELSERVKGFGDVCMDTSAPIVGTI